MIYLYLYIVFALIVAIVYTFLYHKYFMPTKVKYAPKHEKIRVYGTLFISVFACAPYCLIEMIQTKRKRGFKR